nr:hypothetical protein [Tanacetum cinerariifolium]
IIMVKVIPLDHVDNVTVVEPNQHDDVPVIPEPVLVDEDEDPKEDVGNKMHKAFPLPVIEFPLAEELPTASEEGCHCQKKSKAIGVKIALLSIVKKKLSVKVK